MLRFQPAVGSAEHPGRATAGGPRVQSRRRRPCAGAFALVASSSAGTSPAPRRARPPYGVSRAGTADLCL